MPYTPVNFQDGVTPLNAATMNKLDDALEDLYTNPAAALTYEGDHVPATSYQDGDIVVKDGIAYLCVGGPTTQAPNPVPWGPAGMMGGYIKTTDRGVANGVASLDANTKVPQAQLSAFTDTSGPLIWVGGATYSGQSAVGRWSQSGKTVTYMGAVNITAGWAGGGAFEILLPVAARPLLAYQRIGWWVGYDASTGGQIWGWAALFNVSTTRAQLYYPTTVTGTGGAATVDHVLPWIWAQSDQVQFQFTYEAA